MSGKCHKLTSSLGDATLALRLQLISLTSVMLRRDLKNRTKRSFWAMSYDRHSLGERPENFLNARLNAASES
jgi:hypothetical protein